VVEDQRQRMNLLDEIAALSMSGSMLKQAINSGMRELVNSKTEIRTEADFTVQKEYGRDKNDNQETEEPSLDIFVATNQIREQFQPKTTTYEIVSERTTEIEELEIVPLAEEILDIQDVLSSNLRTIIGGAKLGTHTSDVEIITETPEYYILYDHQGVITEGLQADCRVTHTTIAAHAIATSKILDRLRIDSPDRTAPQWLIKKPTQWYDGQWGLTQTLKQLIQIGLSPTEVLDYWMVSIMNLPVSHWSHVRETSESAIYTRVRGVEEKIENQPQQEIASEYDYFERTYTSTTVNDKELITTDNGLLHPRRDIVDSSATGHMMSGYSGAGSKQLATAILADAFDRETALKYNQRLNGQIHKIADSNDDGGWTLSKDDLSEWLFRITN